ncbi:hypothetical protein G1J88_10365 [Tenacibaculum dicentrarchi]|nr:hypothetical protein [Tenacibaculum dicentrarchi]MDB0602676.1 hypothetical protein [Tenacibaculum maritimum]MCD8435633.1 hypothetical protein [Tenacibaculum dicentrarchi]MCD8438019.1 hypothetical protein [Tenacibaculum dicentrarchi]MCD8443226.1 hypothetical protein [Tenacibaculum dicentrarchi]
MKYFIYLFIAMLLLGGCRSSKVVTEKEKIQQIKVVSKKNDSSLIKIKTLPIKDIFFVGIKTNNKQIDSVINLKFKHFKTAKISGTNSFTASFDTVKKGFQFIAKVSSSEIQKVKIQKMVLSKEKNQTEIVKETKVIKYRRGFLVIGFLVLIVIIAIRFYLKFL